MRFPEACVCIQHTASVTCLRIHVHMCVRACDVCTHVCVPVCARAMQGSRRQSFHSGNVPRTSSHSSMHIPYDQLPAIIYKHPWCCFRRFVVVEETGAKSARRPHSHTACSRTCSGTSLAHRMLPVYIRKHGDLGGFATQDAGAHQEVHNQHHHTVRWQVIATRVAARRV